MSLKKMLLFGMLILPLAAPAVVFANESGDKPVSSRELTAEEKRKALEKRIADRKAKPQSKLTPVQQNVVKTRCQVASSIIGGVQSRVTAFEQKRPDLYGDVVTKLEALGPRLAAADVDTASYDKQISELKTKVAAFDKETTALKTAVDDLPIIDCVTDPEAFVATVRESATSRQQVINTGREIRAYLKETVKPTLAQIQKDLQPAKEKNEE